MGKLSWTRNIRYIIFDWGGTLCRNDRERDAVRKGIEAVVAQLSIDPASCASVAASLGKMLQDEYAACDLDPEHREVDAAVVIQRWGDQMGFTQKRSWDLSRMVDGLWGHWHGCGDPLDDPVGVLSALKQRGYVLGLLSNVAVPAEICRGELRRLCLLDLFQAVTFSSELGLRKPHKALFDTAVTRLASGKAIDPQSVVYVGDSPRWDVGGARGAGLRAVLFRSPASTWPEEDYETYSPDAIVDRLAELLILLPQKAPA